jgi:hypothetical protein
MSEERFFGRVSDNAAQIPFLLRVAPTQLTEVNWSELQPRRFDQGRGSSTRSGLIYLGFPFGMRGGERSAIAPAQECELCGAIIREENNPAFRQALLPAWWLLGHLGGVGSRSLRGFGSLALTDWRIEPDHADWPECHRLPLLAHQGGPSQWRAAFQQVLGVLQNSPSRPGLSPGFRRPGEEEPNAQASIKDAVLEEQIFEAEQLGETLENWGDAQQLRAGFLRLWRRFREDLVFRAEPVSSKRSGVTCSGRKCRPIPDAPIIASGITCGSRPPWLS